MRIQSEPALPLHIIRIIFEKAANEDIHSAAQLARVSCLVQHWIDPILYSSIALTREKSSRAFLWTVSETSKRGIISATVRSLSISFNPMSDDAPEIILACPSLRNLTLYTIPTNREPYSYQSQVEIQLISWNYQRLQYALSRVRPRRVQIQLGAACYDVIPCLHKTFFQYTTHLSITDEWEFWTTWSNFSLLSSLSHISFDLQVRPEHRAHQSTGPRLRSLLSKTLHEILKGCTNLELCIIRVSSFGVSKEYITQNLLPWISDRRLVYLFDAESIFGHRTAHDMSIWELPKSFKLKFDQEHN